MGSIKSKFYLVQLVYLLVTYTNILDFLLGGRGCGVWGVLKPI